MRLFLYAIVAIAVGVALAVNPPKLDFEGEVSCYTNTCLV